MEETVQDGGGQDRVIEDLTPVEEALVAGDDEAGYNVSPEAWFSRYDKLGRVGTFITDKKAISEIIGEFESHGNEIYVTTKQAMDLEQSLGLQPGSLSQGFRISKVLDVVSRSPASPYMYESNLFLGPGQGLPGGGPELIIKAIPTQGDAGIIQFIVHVIGE